MDYRNCVFLCFESYTDQKQCFLNVQTGDCYIIERNYKSLRCGFFPSVFTYTFIECYEIGKAAHEKAFYYQFGRRNFSLVSECYGDELPLDVLNAINTDYIFGLFECEKYLIDALQNI